MTREEAIDVLKHNYPSACFTDLCEAVEIAIQALSAQPERKKGEWIRLTNDLAQCSECKDYIDNAIRCGYNYCPNCGSSMKGEP